MGSNWLLCISAQLWVTEVRLTVEGEGDVPEALTCSRVLEKGVRIKKETERQKIELGEGLPVNTGNSLKFITQSPYIPQSKGEGRRRPSHDIRNKQA